MTNPDYQLPLLCLSGGGAAAEEDCLRFRVWGYTKVGNKPCCTEHNTLAEARDAVKTMYHYQCLVGVVWDNKVDRFREVAVVQ